MPWQMQYFCLKLANRELLMVVESVVECAREFRRINSIPGGKSRLDVLDSFADANAGSLFLDLAKLLL